MFKDLRLSEGKRQEEVILNVYRKKVDAGFVRESALDVLKEEVDLSEIRIVATTPYIANWPFAAAKKTEGRMTRLVEKYLLSLDNHRVLSAAGVRGFKAANDRDFDTLRQRIKQYENH